MPKDMTLDKLMEVTDHLPEGWTLNLWCSQTEMYVELRDPKRQLVIPECGISPAENIYNAVNHARKAEGYSWINPETGEAEDD